MNTITDPAEFFKACRARCKDGDRSWMPSTKEIYWDQLGAVPPEFQGRVKGQSPHISQVFASGEPNHHNRLGDPVYLCFRWRGGVGFVGFEARYASLPELFKELNETHQS